jgi:hypothetical protein
MITTLLATKEGSAPIAKSDDHHFQMSQDSTISEFPPVFSPDYNKAGDNAAQNAEVLMENINTDFFNKRWRPLMAYQYAIICLADFLFFPIFWSLLQALHNGQVQNQWNPITLQGAGLYHLAMGAILGIAAYGRTKEKIAGIS